jgi:pimeloyl-ACP methyl ester carboxylesterase
MAARTARRGIESSQRLGRYRWRVERALSWMSCWCRLQVRWDRDAGRWFAFALLACALVPDYGHLSTLERPQQVTQALVEWLQA